MNVLIVLIVILILAAAGFAGWWFFLKDESFVASSENFLGNFAADYKVENSTRPMNADMPYYTAPGFMNRLSPRFDNTQIGRAIWKQGRDGQPLGRSTVSGAGSPMSGIPEDPLATCQSCNNGLTRSGESSNPTDPNNTIVIDRLIFANKRSKTRGQADPIRGDLSIAPNNPGWFGVSATPQIDLQRGALQVMAGDNETTKAMNDLITLSKTNLVPDNGLDYANTMYVQLGNRGADVNVAAFP